MSAISNPTPTPAPPEIPTPAAPVPVAPVPAKPSKRGWWIWAVVLAAAGLVAYQFLWREKQQKPAPVVVAKTVKVSTGILERKVRLAGSTSAREYANIVAPILRGPESGRPMILEKLAPSGTRVKNGDLLVQIDAQSARDHMDDTMATVVQAQSDIKKRKSEQLVDWETLQQTLRAGKAQLDKARLDAQAAEVRTEVERMLLQLAYEEADARYKQLQADLAFKKESQAADLRILEITLGRHQRHYDRHEVDIVKFTMKSPIEGLVVYSTVFAGSRGSKQIEEGDQVFPGMQIMKVVNPASMQVEARINQSESDRYRVGQQAAIYLDAFPGLRFPGKVYSIGALAVGGFRQNFYIRNVPVKVTIEGSDEKLIPDLSAAAEILIERSEPSVLAPLNAIQEKDGKFFAAVKKAQGFETREVQLGIRNDTHATVLAGLAAGDEVRID